MKNKRRKLTIDIGDNIILIDKYAFEKYCTGRSVINVMWDRAYVADPRFAHQHILIL